MLRMIYLTGDTHRRFERLNTFNAKKGDYLIVLGDFGLMWDPIMSDDEHLLINSLSGKPYTILFVDGNHENFFRLDRLEEVNKFGGKVGVVANNIFHLKRGEIYNIDDNKIFTFGGGDSIDRVQRKEWISWWAREMPSYDEYKHGLENLNKHNFDVDYVLTHTAPVSTFGDMAQKYSLLKTPTNALVKYLEEVKVKLSYKRWYFGHFHFSDDFSSNCTCLYQQIIELGSNMDSPLV